MYNCQLIITGDVNIRLDHPEDASSINVTDLVTAFGLTQRIDEPKHDLGGILDVVVSRDCTPPSKVIVLDVGLTDHRLIQWHLDLEPPPSIYEITVRRSCHNFNIEEFRITVEKSVLCDPAIILNQTDVTVMSASYNAILEKLLDRLVPMSEATRRRKKSSPWFDYECQLTRRQVRK